VKRKLKYKRGKKKGKYEGKSIMGMYWITSFCGDVGHVLKGYTQREFAVPRWGGGACGF
jgi:hypothetical protein